MSEELEHAAALAARWRALRHDTGHARQQLAAAVRAAAAAGTSEYALVKATGMPRSSVRDMLGKPRSRRTS